MPLNRKYYDEEQKKKRQGAQNESAPTSNEPKQRKTVEEIKNSWKENPTVRNDGKVFNPNKKEYLSSYTSPNNPYGAPPKVESFHDGADRYLYHDENSRRYTNEMRTIKSMWDLDESAKNKAIDAYGQGFNTVGATNYQPYLQATNQKAIQGLSELGYDVSKIDDDFYAKNAYLRNYDREGAAGYTPQAPTKKSTPEQNAAYYFYHIQKAEGLTKEAEKEYAELQAQMLKMAEQGKSAEEIVDGIDLSQYKTLEKMNNGMKTGDPLILNRAVPFSEELMYGMAWGAVNKDYDDGNTYNSYVRYALGQGLNRRDISPQAPFKTDFALTENRTTKTKNGREVNQSTVSLLQAVNNAGRGKMAKDGIEQIIGKEIDNPASQLYMPYWKPTNKAITELGNVLGEELTIDQNFFRNPAIIEQAELGRQDGASKEQKAFTKNFDAIYKAEESTRALEEEFERLKVEIATKAVSGMGVEQILKSIDFEKDYKEYGKAKKAAEMGRPLAYNRAVPIGDMVLEGLAFGARNPEISTGDPITDALKYANDEGDTAPTSTYLSLADEESPDKDIYAVPMNIPEAKKEEAERNYAVASAESDKIDTTIKELYARGMTANEIAEEIKNSKDYPMLRLMEQQRNGKNPILLAEPIETNLQNIELRINNYIEEENGKKPELGFWERTFAWTGLFGGTEESTNRAEPTAVTDDVLRQTSKGKMVQVYTKGLRGEALEEGDLAIYQAMLKGLNDNDLVASYGVRQHEGAYRNDIHFVKFGKMGEVLQALDSGELTGAEEARIVTDMLKDTEYAQKQGKDLVSYYADQSNTNRYDWVTSVIQTRKEQAKQEEQERIEQRKAEQNALALSVIDKIANGVELDENEQNFYADMRTVSKDELISDPYFLKASNELFQRQVNEMQNSEYGFTDIDLMEANNQRVTDNLFMREALADDYAMAKASGMSLSEFYEKNPNLERSPERLLQAGKEKQNQYLGLQEGQDFFSWLVGDDINQAKGEGVGLLGTTGRAIESGTAEAAKGFVNFADQYLFDGAQGEEAYTKTVAMYSKYGANARQAVRMASEQAIANETDPNKKAQMQAKLDEVDDIYDIGRYFDIWNENAFQFVDNAMGALNKVNEENDRFMLEHGTRGENIQYRLGKGIVSNTEQMAGNTLLTLATGSPLVASALVYGTSAAGNTAKEYQAMGMDKTRAQVFGALQGISTTLLEKVGNAKFTNNITGTVAGGSILNVVAGGAKPTKLMAKGIWNTAGQIGAKAWSFVLENGVGEGLQEGIEEIVSKAIDSIAIGEPASDSQVTDETLRSAILGAISGLFMGATSEGVGKIAQTFHKMNSRYTVSQETSRTTQPTEETKGTETQTEESKVGPLQTAEINDATEPNITEALNETEAAQNIPKFENTEAKQEKAINISGEAETTENDGKNQSTAEDRTTNEDEAIQAIGEVLPAIVNAQVEEEILANVDEKLLNEETKQKRRGRKKKAEIQNVQSESVQAETATTQNVTEQVQAEPNQTTTETAKVEIEQAEPTITSAAKPNPFAPKMPSFEVNSRFNIMNRLVLGNDLVEQSIQAKVEKLVGELTEENLQINPVYAEAKKGYEEAVNIRTELQEKYDALDKAITRKSMGLDVDSESYTKELGSLAKLKSEQAKVSKELKKAREKASAASRAVYNARKEIMNDFRRTAREQVVAEMKPNQAKAELTEENRPSETAENRPDENAMATEANATDKNVSGETVNKPNETVNKPNETVNKPNEIAVDTEQAEVKDDHSEDIKIDINEQIALEQEQVKQTKKGLEQIGFFKTAEAGELGSDTTVSENGKPDIEVNKGRSLADGARLLTENRIYSEIEVGGKKAPSRTVTDTIQRVDTKKAMSKETREHLIELFGEHSVYTDEQAQNSARTELNRAIKYNGDANSIADRLVEMYYTDKQFSPKDVAMMYQMLAEKNHVLNSDNQQLIAEILMVHSSQAGLTLQKLGMISKRQPKLYVAGAANEAKKISVDTLQGNHRLNKKIYDNVTNIHNELAGMSAKEAYDYLIYHYKLHKTQENKARYFHAKIKERMLMALNEATEYGLKEIPLRQLHESELGKHISKYLSKDIVLQLEMMNNRLPVFSKVDSQILADYLDEAGEIQSKQKLQMKEFGDSISLEQKKLMEDELARAVNRVSMAENNVYPASILDRLRTIRYMNMLGSAPTIIRNVGGNLTANSMELAARPTMWLVDSLMARKTGERTIALHSLSDWKEAAKIVSLEIKSVLEDAKYGVSSRNSGEMQDGIIYRNRYAMSDARGRVYQNDVLENMNKALQTLLALGDRPVAAVKRNSITNELENLAKIENGKEYNENEKKAIIQEETDRATFVEQGKVLTSIQKAFNALPWLNVIQPFTTVPVNIGKRMAEFSPLGMVSAIVRAKKETIQNGKVDQRRFVERLSRGLNGTAMMGLGIAMYSSGLIGLGLGEEEKQRAKELGLADGSQYGAHLKVGDVRIDITNTFPASFPLFLGAIIGKVGQKEANAPAMELVKQSFGAVTDGFLQSSFLSGAYDFVNAGQYGSATGHMANSYLKSLAGQFIPQMVRQVAKTIDPYKRDTRNENALTQFFNEVVVTSIPFLSQSLPKQIDLAGKEIKHPSAPLINPLRVTYASDDPMIQELDRLYTATGDHTVIPNGLMKGSNFTVSQKAARKLTPHEREQYNRDYTEALGKALKKEIARSSYQNMSDGHKSERIEKIAKDVKSKVVEQWLKKVGVMPKEKNRK